MSKQEDKAKQMINEGVIFGRDNNKPPTADDPVVQKLVERMDECDDAACNQPGPHVHLVRKRPEGLDMSNGELQALMQKKFNDQVNKLMRERVQAEKKRKLGLGE